MHDHATHQGLLIDMLHLDFPDLAHIQDVVRKQDQGQTTGQFFIALRWESSIQGLVIAMNFGIGLLQQGQPSLALVLALVKVE